MAFSGDKGSKAKQFENARAANQLMCSELTENGVTAKQLWKEWGIWSLMSSVNTLLIRVDPKQQKKEGVKNVDLLAWLADRMPRFHAQMTVGRSQSEEWASIREKPVSKCCGKHCNGCLRGNSKLLA